MAPTSQPFTVVAHHPTRAGMFMVVTSERPCSRCTRHNTLCCYSLTPLGERIFRAGSCSHCPRGRNKCSYAGALYRFDQEMERGYLINPDSEEEDALEAEMAAAGLSYPGPSSAPATAGGSSSRSHHNTTSTVRSGGDVSDADLFGSAHSGDGDASGSMTSEDVASAINAPEPPGPRLHHTVDPKTVHKAMPAPPAPKALTSASSHSSKPKRASSSLSPLKAPETLPDADRSTTTTSPDLLTPPISPASPARKLLAIAESELATTKPPKSKSSKGKEPATTTTTAPPIASASTSTSSHKIQPPPLPKRKSAVRFDVPSSPSTASTTAATNGQSSASVDSACGLITPSPSADLTPDNPPVAVPERNSSLAPPPLDPTPSPEDEAKLVRILAKLTYLEGRVGEVETLNEELKAENAELRKTHAHLKHTLAVVRGSNRVTADALRNALALLEKVERDRRKLVDEI